MSGDQPGHPAHLGLQRALLSLDPLATAPRCGPARSACRSRRPAPAPRPPCRSCREKTRSRASSSGTLVSSSSAARRAGHDSPVSVERSTSTPPSAAGRRRRSRSPSSISSTSPGHEPRRLDDLLAPVAQDLRRSAAGSAASASTARSACSSCAKANSGVDQDHDDDRDRHRHDPGQPRREPRRPRAAAASGWVNWRASSRGQRRPPRRAQHVGPELDKAALGLARRQPRPRAAQVAQQQLDALLGVDPVRRRLRPSRAVRRRMQRLCVAHRRWYLGSGRPRSDRVTTS